MTESDTKTQESLLEQISSLKEQLSEANETIDAIRSGQIDALVVRDQDGPALYTLKTADQTYRMFIEKMPEGAVTLNRAGIILYSNTRFAAMINCPLSKVTGQLFETFVSPEYLENFRSLFTTSWTKDMKAEITISCGEGSVPVQLSLTTLELDGGSSLNIIVTDLTMQKEAQQELSRKNDLLESLNYELSQSNHDLQQFASVASHDLQEPLRKIQIFSKFLRERDFDTLSEAARHNLEKIISSAQRMKVLIVDILNYSRLSANNTQYSPVDLGTLVSDILDDFELKINERNAVVTTGALPVVEANPGQIRQVFQNLLSNALKFCRTDVIPNIVISQEELNQDELSGLPGVAADYCKISISDNGIGFDDKYASLIFSLFEKLHSKDLYDGTGIGLAITKKIIEKHNGFIRAAGIEEKGAKFTIVLPKKQLSRP